MCLRVWQSNKEFAYNFCQRDPDKKLSGDARIVARQWQETGGVIESLDDADFQKRRCYY